MNERPFCEPHEQVVERFDAAVARHAAHGRPLVISTHGLSLTIWAASRFRLRPSAEQFWADLRFPDLIEIDPGTGGVTRLRVVRSGPPEPHLGR